MHDVGGRSPRPPTIVIDSGPAGGILAALGRELGALRLRQLVCFVRVCELGSITRAAGELNIAQPALGLQIRGLEDEFEATLVERSPRGVRPTAAGEMVLDWARDVIERHKGLALRLKEMRDDKQVTLSVALTSSLTQLLAVPLIERAKAVLPNVNLKIIETQSQYIAEWVDAERIDIGLGFGPFEGLAVQTRPLARERLFYLSAAGGGSAPITLTEVLSLPLAAPDEMNSIRHTLDAAAKSLDLPVISQFEISSSQAAREIARGGLAGAISPYAAVANEFERGELSVRLIVEPSLERPLYLITKSSRGQGGSEQVLLADLLEHELKTAIREKAPEGAYVGLPDLTRPGRGPERSDARDV